MSVLVAVVTILLGIVAAVVVVAVLLSWETMRAFEALLRRLDAEAAVSMQTAETVAAMHQAVHPPRPPDAVSHDPAARPSRQRSRRFKL